MEAFLSPARRPSSSVAYALLGPVLTIVTVVLVVLLWIGAAALLAVLTLQADFCIDPSTNVLSITHQSSNNITSYFVRRRDRHQAHQLTGSRLNATATSTWRTHWPGVVVLLSCSADTCSDIATLDAALAAEQQVVGWMAGNFTPACGSSGTCVQVRSRVAALVKQVDTSVTQIGSAAANSGLLGSVSCQSLNGRCVVVTRVERVSCVWVAGTRPACTRCAARSSRRWCRASK